jgi:hypothetical protein
MAEHLDRRSVVQTLGVAGLTLAVGPGAGYGKALPGTADAPLARWLKCMVADLESARRVGQVYLQKAPEEADRDRLLMQIFPELTPARQIDSPAAWRRAYTAKCRQDFAEGQTVRIDGWVLSLTEARLCALAAIA